MTEPTVVHAPNPAEQVKFVPMVHALFPALTDKVNVLAHVLISRAISITVANVVLAVLEV